MPRTDYDYAVRMDALDTVRNFMEEIISALREKGKAPRDLFNDYPNGVNYHRENHIDKAYNLTEAAALLEELHAYVEEDGGLWVGLAPRDAISIQATYTYGNAVYHYFRDMIADINHDAKKGVLADMIGEDDPASDSAIEGRILELCSE